MAHHHTVTDTNDADTGRTTQLVLWLFAGVYAVAGFAVAAWGPEWCAAEGARVRLIRQAGGLLLAAACVMWGIASVRDERIRFDLLKWVMLAHAAVFLPTWAFTDSGSQARMAFYVFIALLIGLMSGRSAEPGAAFEMTTLFARRHVPMTVLRSSYEQRIRDAASLEERHRLARDLHDSIKQQVFVMQTAAATAQARFDDDPPGAKAALEQVRAAGREATAEMEAMLDQLRVSVLENNGLVEALKKQAEALRFRTGGDVRVDVGPLPPSQAWPPGSHQAVLRVAQEALANVGRHARASHVWVTLESTETDVTLTVRDDGAGRDGAGAGHVGMGIQNMRDRAAEFGGTLGVQTPAGGGTSIVLAIPHAARLDVAGLRRRVLWLAVLVAGMAVGAVTMSRGQALFPLLALNGGFLYRAIVKYRRALRMKNSMPWTPSPSPSSTTTAS
ncbi:MAG: sensor histidine kinase [Vicinamibacterales bacterium]|nr:sensor histidine kinase [Vicinamibacterales bacterium]